jgi:predicted DNA-binding protein YlxM (UPF0122 family)
MIKNLTIEKFCQILDGLPLDFKIELQGKVLSKILMNGKTAWQIDDRVLLNPILFAFKKEIFDAIESKGYSLRNLYFGWVALPKKKLQMLYYKQRKSTGEIAKEYGTTRQSIMKIMKRHGFIRRTRSEARIEAIKRGKFEKLSYEDIDENFFCEWWQEMAWALGLLFTDGHIRGNLVQFTSVDIELLEKVRKLFQSSRQIEKRTQSYDKSKHIYAFTFSHPRIAEDLRKLGLHERKSLNMIFPDVEIVKFLVEISLAP